MVAKGFLKLPNLDMVKNKSVSLPWRIPNSVLNKGKSAIPPLFNGLDMLSFASDKAKLFTENFSKNSNLDDSGISLPVFPCRTNMRLYNISVTPKIVKKVIMNLDFSKASSPF